MTPIDVAGTFTRYAREWLRESDSFGVVISHLHQFGTAPYLTIICDDPKYGVHPFHCNEYLCEKTGATCPSARKNRAGIIVDWQVA